VRITVLLKCPLSELVKPWKGRSVERRDPPVECFDVLPDLRVFRPVVFVEPNRSGQLQIGL
jgi:hypothetical protein